MRTKNFLTPVSMLGVASLMLGCAGPTVDVEAETASIREGLNQSFEAVQNQDWETLGGLISEDWILFTHIGVTWNLEEMDQFFADHISDHSITISNIAVEVSEHGKLAWAKFNEQTEYSFDGNPVQENALFTAIFKKTDGDWKMTHLHRSAPPPGGA